MYIFKTAKMPSSGQMWLLQDLIWGGCWSLQRLQKFLADLIVARKTQHWPVKYIYPQF